MSPRGTLALLGTAQLLIALDHNIVYVALPGIEEALGLGAVAGQWVVSAYALAFGGLLILGGRITDVVGARRAFVVASIVFALASAIGGVAGSGALLVGARAGQGAGAALLFPATLAALYAAFDGADRARAIATWGAAGACGGAFGSVAGGALAEGFGWRAVLLVNVPVATLAAAAAARARWPEATQRGSLCHDAPAAIAATGAATLAVLTLGQGLAGGWPLHALAAAGGGALLMLAAFVAFEHGAQERLLPGRLLRVPSIAAAMAVAFLFMAAFGTQFYLVTVYLQDARGLGSLQAGAGFLPLTLAILAGTQLGGVVLAWLGAARATGAGFGLGAAGMGACATGIASGSDALFGLGMAADGLGQGVAWTGLWALAAADGSTRQGTVSGAVATAQQIGGAAGLAVVTAIVAGASDAVAGIGAAFALCALLLAAGGSAVWFRGSRLSRAGQIMQ